MFVYKLVTSIEARIVFSGNFVFSMKFIKSIESFRKDSCCCAIGCMRRSTKHEILSVGPSHPDIIGLPTKVGL